jgi:hypothetical protein
MLTVTRRPKPGRMGAVKKFGNAVKISSKSTFRALALLGGMKERV